MLHVTVFLCKPKPPRAYLLFGDCRDIVFILAIPAPINDITLTFRNHTTLTVIHFKVHTFEWNIDEI